MAMSPDLQASLLCDDVRQERNGKFILIGIFDGFAVPGVPMMFQRICVVNRWCCGEGVFQQRTRIIGIDGCTPVVEGKEVPVRLDSTHATATSVEIFVNTPLKEAGTYWIEVLLDGDLKLRYPLELRIIKPPEGSRPPEPPAGG